MLLSPPELPAQLDLVAGSRRSPTHVLDGTLDDPNTGEPLQERRCADPAVVDEALAAAAETHERGTWRRLPPDARADTLEALASELDLRAELLGPVESIDTGVPVGITAGSAASMGATVRDAAARLRSAGAVRRLDCDGRRIELHRVPWGVAALILPWNAPAPVLAVKAGNALAAGCPIVVKPSEWAPHAAAFFADAVEAAGLPAGLVSVLHGDGRVGSQLAADPRVAVVSFTGGAAAGTAIATACAPRFVPTQLELGGANAALVLDDADLSTTARALAAGIVKLNGQWCEAPRRIIVGRDRLDRLVEALCAELAEVRVGHSLDPDTAMGPLGHRAHLERVRSQLDRLEASGGRVVAVGVVPALDGWFLAPTLVVGPDPVSTHDEVFGPVAVVHPYSSEQEALELARAPGDGLASYVFCADVERGAALGAELPGGEVKVNGTSLLDLCPESTQSFFGSSGLGGHGADRVQSFYVGSQIIGLDDPRAPI